MAQLLDLPVEIIRYIACTLCDHCYSEDGCWDSDDDIPIMLPDFTHRTVNIGRWGDTVDLSNLSRTCRRLRDIVQPILHRCVFTWNRFHLLARTIAQRPDLGRAVREMLMVIGSGPGEWDVQPDEQAIFDDYVERWYPDLKEGNGLPERFSQHRLRIFQEALSAPIIPRIPNVEHIIINADKLNFPSYPPGSLPHLVQLEWESVDNWANDEDDATVGWIAGIMAAAPALKIFRGLYLKSMQAIPMHMDNLTTVSLEDCSLSVKSFVAIMRHAKALHSFCYTSFGRISKPATPRKIAQALKIRRDTLKWLHLDFQYASYDRTMTKEDGMQSLRDMEVLETLTLDARALNGQNLMDEEEEEREKAEYEGAYVQQPYQDGQFLIEFLPPSIKNFTITTPYHGVGADLKCLAKETPRRFVNLTRVALDEIE